MKPITVIAKALLLAGWARDQASRVAAGMDLTRRDGGWDLAVVDEEWARARAFYVEARAAYEAGEHAYEDWEHDDEAADEVDPT